MKSSSSSQKCSGIPSDSISAKLSPNTWPMHGCGTDARVGVGLTQTDSEIKHRANRSRLTSSIATVKTRSMRRQTNAFWVTHHLCEESLGDGVHRPSNLYADSVARSVFSEPVAALVLTVEPLQFGPSVEAGVEHVDRGRDRYMYFTDPKLGNKTKQHKNKTIEL